jgi:hypothetical protein
LTKPVRRTLEQIAALVWLEKCTADDVIVWANDEIASRERTEPLVEVNDPTLVELASLDLGITSLHEVRGPLASLPDKREQDPMTEQRAAGILKWVYLSDIVGGHIDPRTGATQLVDLWRRGGSADESLSVFYQIVDSWDDYPEGAEGYKREIVKESTQLLKTKERETKPLTWDL